MAAPSDSPDIPPEHAPLAPPSPEPSTAPRAIALGVGSGLIYLLIVGGFSFDFQQTDHPHHILMADAMLHGQFHIRPEALQFNRSRFSSRWPRRSMSTHASPAID